MTGISPTIHIMKIRDKYSVRVEWRQEGYQLVESLDEVNKILKKEFEEEDES